jgi:hypothetical protein
MEDLEEKPAETVQVAMVALVVEVALAILGPLPLTLTIPMLMVIAKQDHTRITILILVV